MDMPTTDETFEPRDHSALMRHFERIGFDPYACAAPVRIYRPTMAIVAERYREFMRRKSDRLDRDDSVYTAMLDQVAAEFRDKARFPVPQT